ncbi:MAG TPA: S-layer homology domain-containing protein [Candidatus Copromonas faecavium]|uniref:S-layer homology domain-containing protein n=1 Tax=Candidatus Copromonas faecavium (nom. illeg.) TaxID=2840740 RepID=A0A9D1D4Q3_9FIRM|nr:S-layer homology domain-containing protein [Candidatus Copromonas faecavium]
MMNLERKAAGALAVCALSVGMTASAYAATSTFDMRENVVSLLGIINTSNYQATVTRAEFARMLMNASDDRQLGRTASNVSVYADVSNTSEYATAIRTASTNGWMTGYLGGNFKPDEPVTMRDAVKATLTLLGYTSEDFTENVQEARLAQFKKLSLDSNIYRELDETLTREDCINLFYNLMKAETKSGTQYGSQVFDLTYNSDGEVNTSSILDNSLKGPKILDQESRNLDDLVPFSLDDAVMFLNGEASDEIEINDDATVIYYHEATKMIFAYSDSGENKGATKGRIKAIYYDSSDPFTPVTVVLNTHHQDNAEVGDEFQISNSEMQYLFSVYGEFEVGDEVAIVWESSGSDENMSYTVVDVVGDY